jgi:hypothetical protein
MMTERPSETRGAIFNTPKIMLLVGFTIEVYHDAWSHEHHTKRPSGGKTLAGEMFCMVCLYCSFLKCDAMWASTGG